MKAGTIDLKDFMRRADFLNKAVTEVIENPALDLANALKELDATEDALNMVRIYLQYRVDQRDIGNEY